MDFGDKPFGLRDVKITNIAGDTQVDLPASQTLTFKERIKSGELSGDDALVSVVRPEELIVRGLNEKGKIVEIMAKGLLARVLLHEIDHINGKLIVDYMNFLTRLKYRLKKPRKVNR